MTSPQPPQKDFLALTHGQEWVNFYESFDLLVQDHLSRSSDLLRRAMSLPEVADREVAQVRDDLEGKLAAERERTNTLLTDLKSQIVNSHRLASTLAMSIGSLMTDLHSLNMRVDEAIQTSSQTAQAAPTLASPPAAPTGLLSSPPPAAASFATATAPGTGTLTGTDSLAASPVAQAEPLEAADEVVTLEEEAPGDDVVIPDAVAGLADEPTMDMADLAEQVDTAGESSIDLTAIAEAEESTTDDSTKFEATDESGASDSDAASETGERQRPHWLSVTRVGASRP